MKSAFLSLRLATFRNHPLLVTPNAFYFMQEVGKVHAKSSVFDFTDARKLQVNDNGEILNADLFPDNSLIVCTEEEVHQFVGRWIFVVPDEQLETVASEGDANSEVMTLND